MKNETKTLTLNEVSGVTQQVEINLSDFALFLSVAQCPPAYEAILSIVMNEMDLELVDVKVERVVLNKEGKRGIRQDAWAQDTEERQYATEMQNDITKDDVKKRSRYYQSLLDSPILKSGKNTKYKYLPSTFVIFITQDDIWGLDKAMYTFTERCVEVPELELGDGTKKIFLNMTSKNGRDELISLLQYMKKTDLKNPEIIIQDKRIKKLDEIVQEVKQSEEWEAVSMSIWELGMEKGITEGAIIKGIAIVRKNKARHLDAAEIAQFMDMDEREVEDIFALIEENPNASDMEIAELMKAECVK